MKNLIKLAAIFSILFFAAQEVKADEPVTKEQKIEAFKKLKIGSAFEVYLKQGDKYHMEITATEEQHERIMTEMHGNTLVVKRENQYRKWHNDDDRIVIHLEFVSLEELDISGACVVEGSNKFTMDALEIDASGASHVELTVDTKQLFLDISGASHIEIDGITEEQVVEASGASKYKGYELQCKKADLRASGASSVRVNVADELEARASGASSIRYRGEPKRFHANSSSASSVRKN